MATSAPISSASQALRKIQNNRSSRRVVAHRGNHEEWIRDRPNPYWGVDPLLAFLLDEVEYAERGVEYRRRELEDATERAK